MDSRPARAVLRFCARLAAACAAAALFFAPGQAAAGSADAERQLAKAIADGDEDRIVAIFEQLAADPSANDVELILQGVALFPSARVYDLGMESLRGLGAENLDGAFRKALKKGQQAPLLAAAVVAAAAPMAPPLAEEWLLLALDVDNAMVQRNAIDALRERKSKNAIPRLIDLLERYGIGKNMVAYEAESALLFLTGREYDLLEDWRKFWDANKDTLDPAKLDAGGGKTGVTLKRPELTVPEFFGVEVVSQKVAFVVDMSGSMTMWDEGGEEGGKGSAWQVRQRVVRTKRQLGAAISKLPRGAYFNIIAFNNAIQHFQRRLVPAVPVWKEKAGAFIDRLEANHATHTDEAMRAAFEDPNVDTIILLSDGAPMRSREEGPAQLIPRILDDVRSLNRLRKVRIYCFGFDGRGEWPPGSKYAQNPPEDPAEMVAFLKQLATENRGSYTSIK
ncbi:MAG: hypothetical protein L0Z55_01580 [Planctomycetes bacterium]|nr:hypothetical protein [Planctomycetota bacterium]